MGNNYAKLSDNENALFYAVKKGDMQMVENLIELKTNVNAQDSSGFTPLLCACSPPFNNSYNIIVKLLASKANPNIKNCIGETSLLCALSYNTLSYNNKDIIYILLQNNANPNAINDRSETPMYLAIFWHQPDIVTKLLQCGANPNIAKRGTLPLHQAIENGNKDIVIRLLQYSANLKTLNNKNMNALDYAISKDKSDIVAELLKLKMNNKKIVPFNSIINNKPENDRVLCPICIANVRNIVFNCGHSICMDCSNKISECSECRSVIVMRNPLYL